MLRFLSLITVSFFVISPSQAQVKLPDLGNIGPRPLFDSAHSIAIDAVISKGKILVSKGRSVRGVESEIRQQLYYTVGQLNGVNGVGDLNRLELSVGERVAVDPETESVSFAAKLLVAWPRALALPERYTFVLPSRGDYESLGAFFDTYGADEHDGKKCLASEAHDVSQDILWYYYRPMKRGCPLAVTPNDSSAEPLVARLDAQLSVSAENTEGKSPEYAKVWEDGRLVVTAIFGMNEHDTESERDAGVQAYRQTRADLQAAFGVPIEDSIPAGELPGLKYREVSLTFRTKSGPLEAHLFLVPDIKMVDTAFRKRYNELTQIADFVSYSGHSGLGANIQAMARMGQFKQGQYQIFLINGCDTFAYVDNALRDAHAVANPGYGKDKYFDVVTNAMPSYFHMNSRSNLTMVRALVNQTKTYRQILAGFDDYQKAVVTGEQDNLWPADFGETKPEPTTQPTP